MARTEALTTPHGSLPARTQTPPFPWRRSSFSVRSQEVAARSQRQLVVVAIAGTLISIGIVVTFILFHVFSLAGGDGAVTGSSLIEAEKHIVHMYKKVSHAPLLLPLAAGRPHMMTDLT